MSEKQYVNGGIIYGQEKEFKDVRQLLAENLEKAYERWDLLYKNGGSDPFWCDGTNLNLVRNHILYYREQCEEVLEPKDYPEAYHKELPPVSQMITWQKKVKLCKMPRIFTLPLQMLLGMRTIPM